MELVHPGLQAENSILQTKPYDWDVHLYLLED